MPRKIPILLAFSFFLQNCIQSVPWPKEEGYPRHEVCESKELDIRHFHGTKIDKAGAYEYLTIDDRPSIGIRLIWQNFIPSSNSPYYYLQEKGRLKEIDYSAFSMLYNKYFGGGYRKILLERFSEKDLDEKLNTYFGRCKVTGKIDNPKAK